MSKINIQYKLKLLMISLMMLIPILFTSNPLTVNAATVSVDVLSSNFTGTSGTYRGGITYTRTGFLCYLVEENGTLIDGMQGKAFQSPGYSALGNESWRVRSKKGDYSVYEWTGNATNYWSCTPFGNKQSDGTVPSNADTIKSWAKEKKNGVQNAVQFVQDVWHNDDYTDKFRDGDYVLVMETILSFQPCVNNGRGSEGITAVDIMDGTYPLQIKMKISLGDEHVEYSFYPHLPHSMNYAKMKHLVDMYNMKHTDNKIPDSSIQDLMKNANDAIRDAVADEVRAALEKVKDDAAFGKEPRGNPVIGTLYQCISYQRGVGGDPAQFASYTNKIACFAEYIQPDGAGERAGYKPWLGPTSDKILDDAVWNYGVGMLVISAKDKDMQTTCDEPLQPEPHTAAKESTGEYDIIKNYRTMDKMTGKMISDDGCFITKDVDSKITIEEEEEYKVVGWVSSYAESREIPSETWNTSVPLQGDHRGTSPGEVELNEPEKCLYVLLERKDEEEIPDPEPLDVNYVLSESTITRQVWFSSPDNQLGMPKIQEHWFKWSLPAHKTSCSHTCSGHYCTTGHTATENISHADAGCTTEGCTTQHTKTVTNPCTNSKCVTHTAKCSWKWIDRSVTFALDNEKKNDFPYILATKASWQNVTTLHGIAKWNKTYNTRKTAQQYNSYNGLDYMCVLLRGDDKLTVAKWKNADLKAAEANTDLDSVSISGFKIADMPADHRKTEDYTTDFKAAIKDDSPDRGTIYGAESASSASCGQTFGPCTDTKNISLETPLDVDVSVKLEVHVGDAEGHDDDISCNPNEIKSPGRDYFTSSYNHVHGKEIEAGSIDVIPYIQMNYDTATKYDQTAYVLGEYKRTIKPHDFGEIAWNEEGSPKLTLSSLQWSTHNNAVTKWGKGSVIPGGATISLGIKDTDRQHFKISTYQTVLMGKGLEQVEKTIGSYDGDLTESNAINAHEAYVSTVRDAIESLNVEQWANKNEDAGSAWNGGKAVYPGCDLGMALGTEWRNLTGSDEAKYYFRNDGEQGNGAGEGDLDVNVVGTDTKYYTFFTNTKGEIRIIEGQGGAGEVNVDSETKGRIAELSDPVVAALNKRTHVYDKMVKVLERQTGNDTSGRSKTGAAWYNESWDGLTIMVQQTEMVVGYKDPPERSSVIDTRLTRKNTEGQKGMFADGSYVLSQYRTKSYAELYGGDNNKVGEFKGVSIYTEDMNMMFFSRPFWIANMNTQDLH